ncbi:MarR family winged helix-turn-helix transcriptional regulator [Symbioplanes lichenis]|uniref:MarR family winged helix-turn-helix transcriptional regulator n=1 Tax=Symbioplanes lichenis TaxID=1629072 RepID=UPI002739D001|nr:MarR family transcriptional regulator [Actinoplanes lichenis]
MDIVAALVRTSFLVDAVYTESAREYGITQQQGQLLCVLMPRAYAMGELSTTLRLAKSSLSGLVDRTERLGLVRREPDPRDTRGVLVGLTADGDRLARQFYDETCRRIAELPAGLAGGDRETLAGLLARVVLGNEVPVVFPAGAGKDPAGAGKE